MALSLRDDLMASLLALNEASGWAGEVDGSAHIDSYSGVHNWRTSELAGRREGGESGDVAAHRGIRTQIKEILEPSN